MTMVKNQQSNIQSLAQNLLLSLDESHFFNNLAIFFQSELQADRVLVYRFNADGSAQLMSQDGKSIQNEIIIDKGQAAAGYIYRSKRGYFSNSVERDPVFQAEAKLGVKAELCFPIISDLAGHQRFAGWLNRRKREWFWCAA